MSRLLDSPNPISFHAQLTAFLLTLVCYDLCTRVILKHIAALHVNCAVHLRNISHINGLANDWIYWDLGILIDMTAGGCLAYNKLLHQSEHALNFRGLTSFILYFLCERKVRWNKPGFCALLLYSTLCELSKA